MSPRPYEVVCLDLDHTLLDSETSEAMAFDSTLKAGGVVDPSVHFGAFVRINRAMWVAVEAGDMAPGDVRLARFREFVVSEGLDIDPAFLADTYAVGLASHGELFEGAVEALESLGSAVRLALVTNGVSDIQRARIERLGIGPYFDAVVISSEIGASKPATAFFDVAFEHLDAPNRSEVLMVGDSLTSDIAGGIGYGIDTCWFNPAGNITDLPITHEIQRLVELPPIVVGG